MRDKAATREDQLRRRHQLDDRVTQRVGTEVKARAGVQHCFQIRQRIVRLRGRPARVVGHRHCQRVGEVVGDSQSSVGCDRAHRRDQRNPHAELGPVLAEPGGVDVVDPLEGSTEGASFGEAVAKRAVPLISEGPPGALASSSGCVSSAYSHTFCSSRKSRPSSSSRSSRLPSRRPFTVDVPDHAGVAFPGHLDHEGQPPFGQEQNGVGVTRLIARACFLRRERADDVQRRSPPALGVDDVELFDQVRHRHTVTDHTPKCAETGVIPPSDRRRGSRSSSPARRGSRATSRPTARRRARAVRPRSCTAPCPGRSTGRRGTRS